MDMESAIEELRRNPHSWLGYDEETRELLKQQASEASEARRKEFDPLTGATILA